MRETMSLVGGLDMYAFKFGSRYKSGTFDKSPEGRKVVFLNENGYDVQREHARMFFKEGDILTVKEIYVGRSSSDVEFVEVPNQKFNTVMFADAE